MEESLADRDVVLRRVVERRVGERVPAEAPDVSVVIPAYNVAPLIRESVESVLAQTHPSCEVIVVNDGSDDTPELIEALSPCLPRIVYVEQVHSGAPNARNVALCLARGRYAAFLDGDDQWLPRFLESQLAFLEANGFDMVYSDAELFGDDLQGGPTFMAKAPSDGTVTPESLITGRCNVSTSSTVVRLACLAAVRLFDTRLARAQGFDLWLRLALHGAKIGYQREILTRRRVSPAGLSGSTLMRVERSVDILEYVRDKYEFSSRERDALDRRICECRAVLEVERGKQSLVEERFDDAAQHFRTALACEPRAKLRLLALLVSVAPRLSLRLFRTLRPAESGFIERAT